LGRTTRYDGGTRSGGEVHGLSRPLTQAAARAKDGDKLFERGLPRDWASGGSILRNWAAARPASHPPQTTPRPSSACARFANVAAWSKGPACDLACLPRSANRRTPLCVRRLTEALAPRVQGESSLGMVAPAAHRVLDPEQALRLHHSISTWCQTGLVGVQNTVKQPPAARPVARRAPSRSPSAKKTQVARAKSHPADRMRRCSYSVV